MILLALVSERLVMDECVLFLEKTNVPRNNCQIELFEFRLLLIFWFLTLPNVHWCLFLTQMVLKQISTSETLLKGARHHLCQLPKQNKSHGVISANI